MFDFFYSDPHYGHADIIEHCKRPFRDVEHMNAELERRYTETLLAFEASEAHAAVVLWCGDCAWAGFDLKGLLRRLPGRKVLVRGNHDKANKTMLEAGFEMVVDRLDLLINGRRVTVCHYPPKTTKSYRGEEYDGRFANLRPTIGPDSWAIHGHSHEYAKLPGGRRVHVGVDAWDYAPVSRAAVAALIPTAASAPEERPGAVPTP